MKVNELIDSFQIWITNEEKEILKKLNKPVRLSSMSEHEQVRIEYMIRKSIITKIGHKDPMVVINEQFR